MITKSGFRISHSNGVVTVQKLGVDSTIFDQAVREAQELLKAFNGKQINTWGCDGVGYMAQRATGEVIVHKSTVGPVQFLKGIKRIQANERA